LHNLNHSIYIDKFDEKLFVTGLVGQSGKVNRIKVNKNTLFWTTFY